MNASISSTGRGWPRHGKLIAIGASTGGTEAIKRLLSELSAKLPGNLPPTLPSKLPTTLPGIVIVQHMPPMFVTSFAQRLTSLSGIQVIEAQGGEIIMPGHAYVAPGDAHLTVRRSGDNYRTELSQAEPVNRHRPSVDTLFDSVALDVGEYAIGVILTGMGKDGAQGLLKMHQAGAWTIGQDEASCVVYGMPRAAAQLGALDEVAPLSRIAGSILARLGM
jgi:two-component system chemotaxis response regulator CheB